MIAHNARIFATIGGSLAVQVGHGVIIFSPLPTILRTDRIEEPILSAEEWKEISGWVNTELERQEMGGDHVD